MKRPTRSLSHRTATTIRSRYDGHAPLVHNIATGVVVTVADKRGHGAESRGAAAGAATGALVGSFLGPLGALVGGGVGGLVGFHLGGRNR
jgi:hypothetical protein